MAELADAADSRLATATWSLLREGGNHILGQQVYW